MDINDTNNNNVNEIDLKNEDTIGLAVLEETSEGKTKVLLPLELHVRLVN